MIFSVSEANNFIKALLDAVPQLQTIFVRGEISNYKLYPSGHHYFTLKDEGSALKCVMFRGMAGKLRFRPENGMKVIAFGRIGVFPRDGAYQLYCSELSVEGVGDLHVAFEQLKEKLFKEGLFAPEHKKPLPKYPKRIAIITSSAGAAVHDMLRILNARWPMSEVVILPVRVQGAEAPPEIAGALRYANKWQVADLIITGRGGGSIEDLWAFNDERVARAIYASDIPVISAVGHEPDVTIADFVADARASTPSNAAEIAVPDREELLRALAVANLVTIHLKTGIGRLSAYCGAVSAGCGAAAGLAYLQGGDYDTVAHTVVNTVAMDSGIICDGAKASCAAKIAAAVDAGLLGLAMYRSGNQFFGGDGIVKKGVENTIANVGRLARLGMAQTDKQIIQLMMES